MATNTSIPIKERLELVSEEELAKSSFEEILTQKMMRYKGYDYRQIANMLGIIVKPKEKSRYAHIAKAILLEKLRC